MKLSLFIAGCFGIVGFILATLAGLYVDNTFSTILTKAMMSSAICYIVGYLVGLIAQFIAREHALAIAKKVAELDAAEAARKEEEAAALGRQAVHAAHGAQVGGANHAPAATPAASSAPATPTSAVPA